MLEWSIPHVAWFSLAWFVVGVLVGVMVPRLWSMRKAGKGRRPRGPRRSGGSRPKRRSSSSVEIYVGNLAYSVSNRDVAKAFGRYGEVLDVRIIRNKANGKSKGYGFVEMADQRGADEAVSEMNGAEIKGRRIVANEAKSNARDRD